MHLPGMYLYLRIWTYVIEYDLTKFYSNKSLNKMINQGRRHEFKSGGAQIISRENKINSKITSKWLGAIVWEESVGGSTTIPRPPTGVDGPINKPKFWNRAESKFLILYISKSSIKEHFFLKNPLHFNSCKCSHKRSR
mgnify:CR=1 FL=1